MQLKLMKIFLSIYRQLVGERASSVFLGNEYILIIQSVYVSEAVRREEAKEQAVSWPTQI